MHVRSDLLVSSPTDLAAFISCPHKTALDRLCARGRIRRPTHTDPLAEALRQRGQEHEQAYVARLGASGLAVADLTAPDDAPRPDPAVALARTRDAMARGVDVIVQAALGPDPGAAAGPVTWFGYADVLRRVAGTSALGGWHYEVHDTKLARETRGGTILQLCVYSELVADAQGRAPEHLHVVTPTRDESYRVDAFSAFYRSVVARYAAFLSTTAADPPVDDPYPEPVDHCLVCRWWETCNRRRRADDHLRFVAGLGRSHQVELESRAVPTLAALAIAPLPIAFRPRRGSTETYAKLREQARLQATQRARALPTFELLDGAANGLGLLPAPSPGDLFIDFESDPFGRRSDTGAPGETSREYMVGIGRRASDGAFAYEVRWAFTDREERDLVEWLVDELTGAIDRDGSAHIYHYAAYETTAIRRLVARHATREIEVDRLLRGARFIDLYGVVRRTLRAGVESYSIKSLEPFYGFAREVDLESAGDHRRLVELALETGDPTGITRAVRQSVEGYNRDDCRSTVGLRAWLEELRAGLAERGIAVTRPSPGEGEASERVGERDAVQAALRARLLARVPPAGPGTDEERALWRLAYFVDWHRREERVAWGNFHRLREMPREDLLDEGGALVGLEFVARVDSPAAGSRAKAVTDRYRFPPQECDIRARLDLHLPDDTKFGKVVQIDRLGGTIEIRKAVNQTDVHPSVVIALDFVGAAGIDDANIRLAAHVADAGFDDVNGNRLAHDLLLARPPRLDGASFQAASGESTLDFAVRAVQTLERGALAVQGPPGSGKTFLAARMIVALVEAGRRVGVVATGHRVIRKLLADAVAAATPGTLAAAHKIGEGFVADGEDEVTSFVDNDPARRWLLEHAGSVMGGTAWFWSREDMAQSVDVLFVDEAGQMSLANAVAVSQAARHMVLLGDPQQLVQPQQASHPEGVGVSALEHLLGGHVTMPQDRGIFLEETWRMAPAICRFTSELFYEGRLTARPGRARQRIDGCGELSGAGLRLVEVDHDGCRNTSEEEVDEVDHLVRRLLEPSATWTDHDGIVRPLTARDILVVAPFNVHVARLRDRLAAAGVSVGTVDKFQGQEAAVVIYSMAASRPEDAPRGMGFLYSLHRLNVATSRAKCLTIVVANPRLFVPDCRTPRDMQLANALCRYREMARQ